MLHCVIPQINRHPQPPLRIHAPDRIFYGFRKTFGLAADERATDHASQKPAAPRRGHSKSAAKPHRIRHVQPLPPRHVAVPTVKLPTKCSTKPSANPVVEKPACTTHYQKTRPVSRILGKVNKKSRELLPLFGRVYPNIPIPFIQKIIKEEAASMRRRQTQAAGDSGRPAHYTQRPQSGALMRQVNRRIFTASQIKLDQFEPSKIDIEIELLNVGWRLQLEKALARAICGTLVGVLRRRRTLDEMQSAWYNWNHLDDLSIFHKQLKHIKPIFTLQDLTRRILEFPQPVAWRSDVTAAGGVAYWLHHCPLPVANWDELRETFAELSPIYDNYAVDYFEEGYKIKQQRREDRLNRALKGRDVLGVIRLCRLGCSPSNRDAAWTLILRDKPQEKAHYKRLLADYVKHELFLDWTVLQSVAETVGNSHQFFNFISQTQQVMQLFLRDFQVADRLLTGLLIEPFEAETDEQGQCLNPGSSHRTTDRNPLDICQSNRADVFASTGTDQDRGRDIVPYPPSGVMPFHEMSMYAGPLAYVCIRTKPCYFMFRELYCRHFQFLHNASAHPQSIVSLYALFENVLFSKEPLLWEHLRVKVNLNPAEFVVPWLTMAFSGFIEIDQLLVLWDRMVGFSDLRVLVFLAVGVFVLRRKVLLKCKNGREAGAALSDILSIEVIPLLQLALFT